MNKIASILFYLIGLLVDSFVSCKCKEKACSTGILVNIRCVYTWFLWPEENASLFHVYPYQPLLVPIYKSSLMWDT